MSANPNSDSVLMTKAEYLEFERSSEMRHEYVNGEVFAMAGASPTHNDLVMTLSYLIFGHLIGKNCDSYGENQRIMIESADTYLYPDMSVVCGEKQFTDDKPQALLNPILIIEVLSPSTEKFDRDEKFGLYRQLESFREYMIVWQDKAKISRYYLNDENIWEFADANGRDANITLKSIDCMLTLEDVYQRVTFENE